MDKKLIKLSAVFEGDITEFYANPNHIVTLKDLREFSGDKDGETKLYLSDGYEIVVRETLEELQELWKSV